MAGELARYIHGCVPNSMVAKFIPGACDLEGTAVLKPRAKHGFRPTFPMETYLTQPLTLRCQDLHQIRQFLCHCRYVSDKSQFRTADYWMPPEEFERRRRGDCDCAALWAWRQLLDLGYEARFVVGQAGALGWCHAWVTFKQGDEWFVLEPFMASLGAEIPRLQTLYYQPGCSASWDGQRLRYYEHKPVRYVPGSWELASLWMEASIYWVRHAPRITWWWVRYLVRKVQQLPGRMTACLIGKAKQHRRPSKR
jgi:hypothetical protein